MGKPQETGGMPVAEEHVGLVFHWAASCKRRKLYQGIDANELIQEGYLGLNRAVQKYDSAKGQFSTYATKWIRKYMREFRLRAQKEGGLPCDSRRIDNRDIIDAEAPCAAPDAGVLDAVVDSEAAAALALAVGNLDARARDIVTSRFGILRERETYREIARRHGISATRVQQIERRSLTKMRTSKFLTHFQL